MHMAVIVLTHRRPRTYLQHSKHTVGRGNRYDSTRLRLVPIRCLKTTLDSRNGAVWHTAINCDQHFAAQTSKQVAATSRTDRSLCFEQDRAVRGHVRGRQVPQARCPARLAGDAARSETVTSTCERVASTEPSSVVTFLCEYARSGAWIGCVHCGLSPFCPQALMSR
jgi:hypothetical protein